MLEQGCSATYVYGAGGIKTPCEFEFETSVLEFLAVLSGCFSGQRDVYI